MFYNIFVGLEDIYISINVGLVIKIKIDKLDGKFYYDYIYYISVKVINFVNLIIFRLCNIIVEIEVLDISGFNVNFLLVSLKGYEVYIIENSKEFGIIWFGGKFDVEFYGEILFCL